MMKTVTTLEEFWQVKPEERKFYCVGEELTTSYPIQDNGEKIVSVEAYFKEHNTPISYTPPQDIKEINQELKLRATAAEKLLAAAKQLPEGFMFQVSEGYRPLWYQRKVFNQIFADMKKKYPDKSEKEVWEETTMYVSDPDLSPPHSSGGTTDLTIIDKNMTRIDMGNPMNTVGEKSNTFAEGLTPQQEKNRMMLYDTLTNAGFVNIASEWWHYSYGDQYWALYNKLPHALYGPTDA
jgi:D-alanyl-D-alanine dipeptidase